MTTATEDAIKAAMSLGRDLAEGRIDPAALDAELIARCRETVGTVVGSDDPLWLLQVDIARQVLSLGGVPADELAEWLAVACQGGARPTNSAETDG
jgi:hypothetical protein